jgi:hypothetical protein
MAPLDLTNPGCLSRPITTYFDDQSGWNVAAYSFGDIK